MADVDVRKQRQQERERRNAPNTSPAEDDDDDMDDDDEDDGGEPVSKSVSFDPSQPHSVITDRALIKAIGASVQAGVVELVGMHLGPIVERIKALEEQNGELVKALDSNTDAFDTMRGDFEALQKSVADIPETHKLVKSLVEDAEDPANHRIESRAKQTIDKDQLLQKSGVAEIDDEGGDKMTTAEGDEAVALISKGLELQQSTLRGVPGLAEAIKAQHAGTFNRAILEDLKTGLRAVQTA